MYTHVGVVCVRVVRITTQAASGRVPRGNLLLSHTFRTNVMP